MKRLIYQVYVGQPSNLYDACIKSVSDYCKKHNIDHIVQKNSILRIQPDLSRTGRSKEAVSRLGYLPIFEKENAFAYVDKYEQIAIVDSDIYIKPTAPNIFESFEFSYDFGAVAERELPCNKKYKSKIRKYSHNAFGNLKDVDWRWNELGAEFYNMGLIDRFEDEEVKENFADGKNPGRKGLAKRSGVNTKASVSSLRKTAKNSTGEKARMAHWMANMKAGKAKKK